ncbi:MAG: MerR family transcriptional regulator, partial [Burkholderiales bacterium]|nr:MerR family transcriptional regulator [Burkholderiales bacterium]
MLLKIGELASRTGLTVRTLHHYDKIGLLTPSVRSDAGYRLYDRSDITRLHRIQALRRLDLSLAEVARLIDGEGLKLQDVIDQQIVTLDHQIAQSVTLRNRLQELVTTLRTREEPNLEYWLSTLEMMSLQGKYFNE